MRNIAEVTTAVANGDLSKKITVDVKGEILELKNTINTMVDQLSSFASEVTRVAREVGTEGKLGGQAEVQGVAGTWKDLTDSRQLDGRQPDRPGAQHRRRDDGRRQRRPVEEDHRRREGRDPRAEEHRSTRWSTSSSSFASEVTRVAREVGTEGKLGGQADVQGRRRHLEGPDRLASTSMAGNLTGQVRNIADVTTAVANGDLSKKITVDVKGEILELKNTINTMVDQLTLVRRRGDARGARGRHRRQARRPGRGEGRRRHVEGPDRLVNFMAGNLTGQVRNIAEVTTAVANGDLSKKITVDVQGRDPRAEEHHQHDGRPAVARSPSEVTRVAREVGTEGKLGGQAEVHGVAGTWKDLTDTVNFDGRQPDRPGAQHRRGDHRRRQRRPVEEDHGRRARARSSS